MRNRRDALLQRAMKEREKLSTLHLITSADELRNALSKVDCEDISVKKKTERKPALLRDQIIRKKLLKQKIQIPLTQNRRQRPLREVISELSVFIEENSELPTLESLVDKSATQV